VRWVVTLLAMVVGWPERWSILGATSLCAAIEETIEGHPPRLVATMEAPEEGIDPLRRGVLVEVGACHVGLIPWLHPRAARRSARGPPWSVVDEVHDQESSEPKEETC